MGSALLAALPAPPAFIADLPLGIKIAAVVIGVPLLAIAINVFQQLVSKTGRRTVEMEMRGDDTTTTKRRPHALP